MRTLSPATLLLILLFFACQRQVNIDLAEDPNETGGSYTGKKVQANFQGRVLTAAGEPVSAAKVMIGTATILTDKYGVFSLANIETDENFGYVRVEKDGYLAGSRTVLTREASMNFVEIRLMKKSLKGSFESDAAATITLNNGVQVQLPDHSVVTAGGAAYNGKVNVYGAFIDPTATNFAGIMPGDLRGVRTNNDIAALISYGMITVELEGESGQRLKLASNKKASISMAIPRDLLASAPSTIPMWHFSEEKGYWIEEGEGLKTGSMYVAQVSHFSTWNFDIPSNFVTLSMQLFRSDAETMAYKEVKIYQADNNAYFNTAITDSTGTVRMWVPVGTLLKMKVLGSCDQALDSTVIGPFNTDTNLGSVNLSPSPVTIVKGKIVDCNGTLLNDGIVKLFVEGLNYRVSAKNGEFTFNLDVCLYGTGLKGTIKAESIDLHKASEPLQIDIRSGVNEVAELKICSDIDTSLIGFVWCTIGANEYTYRESIDSFFTSITGPYTYIRVFGDTAGQDIYSNTIFLDLPDTIPGIYTRAYGSSVVGADSIYYSTSFSLNNNSDRFRLLLSDTITWDIVNYGPIGGMIDATFTTTVVREGEPDIKIPTSGALRIRRER